MACGCGCGQPNPCTRGVALGGALSLGVNGQSVYAYQAFATAADGTGFSLTYTGVETYRALLFSPIIITSLSAPNFSGLFQKWTGDDGIPGAISREWKFNNDTATTDPTAGFLKLNNSDATAATQVNISETDRLSVSVAALIALVNVSTSTVKAYVQVTKKSDSSKFALYKVTAFVDNGSWDTLTVVYVGGSGSGPFSNNDPVVFSITLVGDKGTAGVIVIENDLSQAKKVTALDQTLQFTVPANTLVNNGDICETDIDVQQNTDWISGDQMALMLSDDNDPGAGFFLGVMPPFGPFRIHWTLSRISATTYLATMEVRDYNNTPTFLWFINFTTAGFNFTTDAYNMNVRFLTVVVSGATSPYATVMRCTTKYFPKP